MPTNAPAEPPRRGSDVAPAEAARHRVRRTQFVSLDGSDRATGEAIAPEPADLAAAAADEVPLIARGSGISFVGASFGEGVRSLAGTKLAGGLDLNVAQRTIRVGAGTTLAELYRETVGRGLYVPVLPGHPQITVGGCIACNVHGKNPVRHGTFVDHVDSLELFHPRHGVQTLSRQSSAEWFELTCGGLGLTGVILSATLRLSPLPSPFVEVHKQPVGSLHETFEALRRTSLVADFAHSWNDVSVFDGRLGRGYVATGRFVEREDGQRRDPMRYPRHDPSSARPSIRWFQPFVIPWIASAFRLAELQRQRHVSELYDFIFPGMGFLNANYYGCYGRQGLQAHVVLVPAAIAPDYLAEVEKILRRERVPLLLASLKPFNGRSRWLRFDGDGTALHAHIPRDAAGMRLAAALDGLSTEARAPRAVYLDSTVTRAHVEACYPEVENLRQRLVDFDPQRRFQSTLSRRLGL